MAKIDESRMAERPEGVTEQQWRAKLEYEAVQAGQAASDEDDQTRTDYQARDAADAVLSRTSPKSGSRKAA